MNPQHLISLLQLQKLTTLKIALLAAALIWGGIELAPTTFQVVGATQNQERIIKKLSNVNEPVKIRLVKTKKGTAAIGKKFSDDDDWVKGLTLNLLNSSPKPITHVKVEVTFSRPENDVTSNEPPLGIFLTYSSEEAKPLEAGESVELNLSDAEYQRIKRTLNLLNYPASIKEIQLYITKVVFADGTLWYTGKMFRYDPQNPGKAVPITPTSSSKINLLKSRAHRPAFFSVVGDSWKSYTPRGNAMFSKTAWIAPEPVQSQCGEPSAPYLRRCISEDTNCWQEDQEVHVGVGDSHKDSLRYGYCSHCTIGSSV
jgi:hypothetical protein